MSKIIYEGNNDRRLENAISLQKTKPPEGTVYISPWGTKFCYNRNSKKWQEASIYYRLMSKNKNSPRVPIYSNKKGVSSMSKKKWVWAGVIVAVITIVIWLYRKLTKEELTQGDSESGL